MLVLNSADSSVPLWYNHIIPVFLTHVSYGYPGVIFLHGMFWIQYLIPVQCNSFSALLYFQRQTDINPGCSCSLHCT